MQKISILLFGVFIFSFSFFSHPIKAAETYPAGTLLSLENLKGSAVYLIGTDEKKHIFPDEKTFMTWHENFTDVLKVNQKTLDTYSEGDQVPYKADVKLITHKNTHKVYAVGENGQLIQIQNETAAVKFYGSNWQDLVNDIDPGIFSATYKKAHGVLSKNNMPEGTLTIDEDEDVLYFIQNGLKRKINQKIYNNNFNKKIIVKAENINQYYQEGDDINAENNTWCMSNVTCKLDDTNESLEYIDLTVNAITWDISNPTVNQNVRITVHVLNNGNTPLTSTTGILNGYRPFQDFVSALPESIPTTSASNPLNPGEVAKIVWSGYFSSAGTKRLPYKVDNANELTESNENNNWYTEYINIKNSL